MKAGFFFCACAIAVLCSSAPGNADTAPIRKLSYTFSYGNTQNTTVHNSGFNGSGGDSQVGGGSGVDSFSQHHNNTGTINVDVMREEADKGLVVSISEQGSDASAKPATCVVYGNGTTICDPNATIMPEEYTVLRFLGPNFVSPSLLDSKMHWQLGSNGPGFTATSDYTIAKNNNGMMSIDETRKLTYTQMMQGTANVTTGLIYDFNHSMPTSIDETTVNHATRNGNEMTGTVIVSARLKNDSLAKTP